MQQEETIVCKTCGTQNNPENKFCKKCGTVLSAQCPKCGNGLEKDAEFCPECGYKLAPQTPLPPPPPSNYNIRKLPLGLEIIIGLGLLAAAYLLFSSMMGLYASSLTTGYEISGFLSTAGLIWGFLGLYFLVVSVGLWKLKEWARKIIMLQALIGIIVGFFEPIPGIASLIYGGLVLWYTNQPSIKILFQTGQTTAYPPQGSQRSQLSNLTPKLTSRVAAEIIGFTLLTFFMFFIRITIPGVYFFSLTFWMIPLVIAFIRLGPTIGLSISILSIAVYNILTASANSFLLLTIQDLIYVGAIVVAISIAQRLVLRNKTQTGATPKILLFSIILGVVFTLIVQIATMNMLYSSYQLSNLPVQIYLLNAIAPILTILIGYPVGNNFRKK